MLSRFIKSLRNSLSLYSSSIVATLPKERLLALDVFRGITITAMILVNNPGSWSFVYPPLLHAKWHGLTPTDLIFPFFVFIVGVSISIVVHRGLSNGIKRMTLMKSAFVRSFKLFILGLMLALFYYNFLDDAYSWIDQRLFSIRVMGVLQRLALVFIFTFAIVTFCKKSWQWAIAIFILMSYWLIMMYVPYSDSQGNVLQGQLLFGNNLAAWLDAKIFAAKHLYYSQSTPFAFDPEGLLSTLPAISGCLFGVFTGDLLTNKTQSLDSKVKSLFVYGVISLLVGYLWAMFFPVNKALWTSTFVLVTTGWALISLSLLTYLIDIKGYKNWSAPFVVFGANAIFFYMFSGVIERVLLMIPMTDTPLQAWIYTTIFQPLFGNFNGSLMYAIVFLLLCYVVMHQLYKRNIFFKV